MENKNIILIIVSVCLFFIVITGASMFLFWPDTGSNYDTAQNRLFQNNSGSTFEYVADAENSGTEDNQAGDENRENNNPDEMRITEQSEEDNEDESTESENNTGVQSLVNGYIEDDNEIKIVERPKTNNNVVTQKPSHEPSTTQTTHTTTQTTNTTTTTVTQTHNQTKPSKEYWIQAASYKSLSSAETMNDHLRDIGITCTIQSKVLFGETWYRLRIGPYGNYNEAEKFLIWIKTIDGLENSLIWEVNN